MTEQWPLHHICEPHETNDVLLLKKTKTILAECPAAQEETKGQYEGNQRLLALIRERQEDYRVKAPMEKPLVALDLLKQWRSLSPPGRFLVADDKTTTPNAPPLWKDVGDKEARSRISKALKQLVLSSSSDDDSMSAHRRGEEKEGSTSSVPLPERAHSYHHQISQGSAGCLGSPQTSTGTSLASTPSMPPSSSMEEKLDSDGPLPRSVPIPFRGPKQILPEAAIQIPRITRLKPKKLTDRRISAQLQAARAEGKIYGRWEERQRLAQILKDASSPKVDFVLIQGPLGVGKTAVARTFSNPMASTEDEDAADLDVKPSFFLEAKFEQLMDPNPYKAFCDIFDDFCNQLCNSNDKQLIDKFRQAITAAFGEDVDVLVKMVPALGPILFPSNPRMSETKGQEETKGSPSGAMMAHKVKPFSVLLLQTMASLVPGKAMVLLLNDLHWASEASMDIFTTLLSDVVVPNQCGLIMAATMNNRKCRCTKPYYERAMKKIHARETIRVHEMTLQNLKEWDVRDFLIDTLDCSNEKILALSDMMYNLTKGNPMFLSEMLRKMQDHGFLYPHEISGDWTYDLAHVRQQFKECGSIEDMVKNKCKLLPDDVRKTMKYCASLGSSKIDESLLKLLDPESVPNHLEFARVQYGMLRIIEDGSYRFSIDGIQHVIYSLMSADEQAALHLEMAQKLWQHLDDRTDKEFLFILLNQLMRGDRMLKQDADRHAVASLCLQAGETSARSLGFQTAWKYLEHGISILPKGKLWNRDNYDLSLRLHNAAIEVCYAIGHFEELHELIDTILEHSRIFEDSLLARSTLIYALGSRHRLEESINCALDTLKELDEHLPANPCKHQVKRSCQKTRRRLRGHTDESILGMRSMKDRKKLAAMQIMNHMVLYTWTSRPYLGNLVTHRMVQITLEYGVCEISSVAFAYYAEYLVGGLSSEIEDGLRYGKLSLELYKRFKNEAWLCRVYTTYYGAVALCKEPIAKSQQPLQHAYRVGLRTGDIEYAMLAGMQMCFNSVDTMPLPHIMAEMRKLVTDMEVTGHSHALSQLQPVWNYIVNFMDGSGEQATAKKGEFMKLAGKEGERLKEVSNLGVSLWNGMVEMMTAYCLGDYDLALKHSKRVHWIYTKCGMNSCGAAYILFFECMVLLANANKGGFINRIRSVSYVKRRMKLLEHWAFMAPENLLDRQHILMAELAVVQNKPKRACLHYRAGILHARSQKRLHIAAVGCERLASFFVTRGDTASALPLIDDAIKLNEEWGANAVARHLQDFRATLQSKEES